MFRVLYILYRRIFRTLYIKSILRTNRIYDKIISKLSFSIGEFCFAVSDSDFAGKTAKLCGLTEFYYYR